MNIQEEYAGMPTSIALYFRSKIARASLIRPCELTFIITA